MSDNANACVDAEIKCSLCQGARCCRYVTHQIDTPRSRASFDHLLWQISHELIEIYKDEDGWFMLINTSCQHLDAKGRCGIYPHRPQICREHSNEWCEYDASAEEGFELYFRDYDELLTYCKARFKSWDKR
ncbi:MAG: YkgJ family cysteine cluster protein [Gammaproteobacteria bacterium]|nr:YkgJ family cysteine cluster protein [Gammaproteobacteria bacterium]